MRDILNWIPNHPYPESHSERDIVAIMLLAAFIFTLIGVILLIINKKKGGDE